MTDISALDLREQLAHIDQMLTNAARKRQEVSFAPWSLVVTGMGTGAALFAAGAAVFKLLG